MTWDEKPSILFEGSCSEMIVNSQSHFVDDLVFQTDEISQLKIGVHHYFTDLNYSIQTLYLKQIIFAYTSDYNIKPAP